MCSQILKIAQSNDIDYEAMLDSFNQINTEQKTFCEEKLQVIKSLQSRFKEFAQTKYETEQADYKRRGTCITLKEEKVALKAWQNEKTLLDNSLERKQNQLKELKQAIARAS